MSFQSMLIRKNQSLGIFHNDFVFASKKSLICHCFLSFFSHAKCLPKTSPLVCDKAFFLYGGVWKDNIIAQNPVFTV